MSFTSLYRVSFYAMLFLATLVLNVDAADSKFSTLFPVAVAVASAAAFLTVDRNAARGISRGFADLLAVGSVGLAMAEFFSEGTGSLLILALGHWLVYLQIILIFRVKTVGGDWTLFLLGLVQVLVGTVISQSDTVGMTLFAWAILSLWVLGLFSLRRDALRAESPTTAEVGDPYPGLFNPAFFLSTLKVTATTLALGGAIFLAMPRHQSVAQARGKDQVGQHLTGFDDEVQLGQLGEILESDNVVMSIELFDADGDRTTLPGEPLWRGVTMTNYEKGRWKRESRSRGTFPLPSSAAYRRFQPAKGGIVRQQIKLESNDSRVLFGLRPMIDATTSRRDSPDFNSKDGTISRSDTRGGTYDYEVRSFLDQSRPQIGEGRPLEDFRERLKAVPANIKPRLREIAERVTATLPPEKRGDVRERARALEEYLRDNGGFGYTLKLNVIDPSLDPVEDFLINRKEGHCEYFASALTLLLRSVDIPARMVNGFKGGDWNELAQVMSVRQKHAHSWVEAYVDDTTGYDRLPIWLTLDPTPGVERDISVAQVSGFRGHFRQVTDLVRYVWVFYVVGYNVDRQKKLIYGPIRRIVSEAQDGFHLMADWARVAYSRLRGLLHFEDAASLISIRGFVVSFVGLLFLLGLFRLTSWVIARLVRWLTGRSDGEDSLSAGAAHYRRLVQLLQSCGLERPAAETQEEFARRAAVFLAAKGSMTESVAEVPRLVVEAFYRVRFGHREIDPPTESRIASRLDDLEASLLSTRA